MTASPVSRAPALPRVLKWLAVALIAPLLLAVLFILVFGWNWLRAPIERMALEKTGRVLTIQGDMQVALGWPRPRVSASAVSFANPAWAQEKQMFTADAVELTLDLSQLIGGKLVFPELRLERPVVFLEQGSAGRQSWLLDPQQQDPGARIQIDRLTLDQGQLGFDDALQKTSIRAKLASLAPTAGSTLNAGLSFSANGKYKGQTLKAEGSGGPVLALRDDSTPYPLTIDASVGQTRVRAQGSITSLLKFTAVDLNMALSGDNLAQLYPLLGIAFPTTRSYVTAGQLRHSGNSWRYDKFSGRIGRSDIGGSLEVKTGGPRPALTAELSSSLLDLADLGPLIGARPGSVQAAKKAAAQLPSALDSTANKTPARARVLPDLPFNTERWGSVDAEVGLRAKALKRDKELPLEDLVVHLSLKDAVLTLDPLNFGLAGGELNTVIKLDGRSKPIKAHAKVRARKIALSKLFPGVELNQNSIGQINGEFNLSGQGNSVARMLATADGKVGLVISGGQISRLMMEKAGLHLWEILQLSLSGDKLIKLRCAVADFEVKSGKMRTDALVLDTQVTTLLGSGTIDLGQEQIDLTFNQKTKKTSPLALRSPIYVRGSFAKPEVGVDKTRVAARALGAVALGLINPLLALLPLIDAGPGQDSDCGQLVREARALPQQSQPKK
ncbi:MAG: AsmA family protein [Gammaproteobacteria bacterium]|uniref:AsmA family protein n=1 Tax=Rhodoferax sp. TaxID=50421 RepID=UPI001809E405|nr:AsmA family protein [Rhodoferax sp.]MBU3900871.1 AsmA family protein [Gammaproteobacteria bacterium]MBA3058661.1 AsmA family protein [Rhodoferax sp.]MBU3998356.1 AsmA family protein [Gammaproteobacteria bacterium]MBU4082225.1 AsmA family protein [Gammaproteobacteria bacterium]MBU4112775.1 AsmA family protein [Gammaproteobacteria bacterium]